MKLTRERVLALIDREINDTEGIENYLEQIQEGVFKLKELGDVDKNWKIDSPHRRFRKIIVFIKRVFNRFIKTYIWDVVDEVNERNNIQEQCIEDIYDCLEKVNNAMGVLAEHEKKIEDISKRFIQAETSGRFELNDDLKNMIHYADFEYQYRGTEDDIEERQKIYVDYFKGREYVVDLGCGRGEFLKLLKAEGIKAVGVDDSEGMLQSCKDKGLSVLKQDIFEFLESQGRSTLDGVFCSQVVEHFTLQQLLKFIGLLKEKVRIGAPVIIETINPRNIVTSANGFYLDLTHVRQINSETLSFLMKKNGFPLQRIEYMHGEPELYIPHLELEGMESFNNKIDNVNELLFGARDYGLIAYRGEDDK